MQRFAQLSDDLHRIRNIRRSKISRVITVDVRALVTWQSPIAPVRQSKKSRYAPVRQSKSWPMQEVV